MREIRTSGSMSGEGKRSDATAPLLDSTDGLANESGKWLTTGPNFVGDDL